MDQLFRLMRQERQRERREGELIENHRATAASMARMAEENRQQQERILQLEQDRIAQAVAQELAEKQRREEALAMHAALHQQAAASSAAASSAAASSAAASAAAAAAQQQAAQGNTIAQAFVQQVHSDAAAASSGRAPMPRKPTPAPERGIKRPGPEIPFQRRPRPAHLDARKMGGGSSGPGGGGPAAAAAREAERAAAPELSVAEVEKLAPYASIQGSVENIIGNMALDMLEKNRRANPKVENFEQAAEKRNDESGAARPPTRFLKYAKHLKTKMAEKKSKAKAEKKKAEDAGAGVGRIPRVKLDSTARKSGARKSGKSAVTPAGSKTRGRPVKV
jgi:hypothetical protein